MAPGEVDLLRIMGTDGTDFQDSVAIPVQNRLLDGTGGRHILCHLQFMLYGRNCTDGFHCRTMSGFLVFEWGEECRETEDLRDQAIYEAVVQ